MRDESQSLAQAEKAAWDLRYVSQENCLNGVYSGTHKYGGRGLLRGKTAAATFLSPLFRCIRQCDPPYTAGYHAQLACR